VAKADYLFTSESVAEGHPEQGQATASRMPVVGHLPSPADHLRARVALRKPLCTTNRIVLAGEVRGPASITPAMLEEVARAAVKDYRL